MLKDTRLWELGTQMNTMRERREEGEEAGEGGQTSLIECATLEVTNRDQEARKGALEVLS